MEASRAQQQQQNQLAAARWAIVRKWPAMNAQHKLAWQYLFERAGRQPGPVKLHAGDIGADQGVAYGVRAGDKALHALKEAKLIEVVEKRGSQWSIRVLDPLDVAPDALRPADLDPQPDLDLTVEDTGQDTEPPPSVPFVPPGQSAGASASASACAGASAGAAGACETTTITITTDNPICAHETQSQDKSGSAGASASAQLPSREEQIAKRNAQRAEEDADGPTKIDDAILAWFKQKQRSLGEDVKDLQNQIRSVVADDSLYESVITKVASAAAHNPKARAELAKMLSSIRNKFGSEPERARERGRYFNISAKNLLNRHSDGLPSKPAIAAEQNDGDFPI